MHSLPVPLSRLYIFLAETCLPSFDLLWVQVVGACFALVLPPPRLFCVVNANFFSDAHLCSPHSLSPRRVSSSFCWLFSFMGFLKLHLAWISLKITQLPLNFSSPRICSPPPCRTSHCLNVLCIEPAVGRGAWSSCPLINPIFFPLICNKAVTNFTAWALCGGPAYLPLAHRNRKAINPLGAITTMKRRAYCSCF